MSLLTHASPPLLPKVDAILVLDSDGSRLAGKYYGGLHESRLPLSSSEGNSAPAIRRTTSPIQNICIVAALKRCREVVTVLGSRRILRRISPGQSGSVRVVHIGPVGESELVLAHLVEGMYEALSNLMGGSTDRNMILDNLELTDGHKLASSVLLRDEAEASRNQQHQQESMGGGGKGGMGGFGGMGGDMTIAQALRQAREQIMSNLNQKLVTR
ncbi:hypothetical protein ACHAWO_005806 [Cyclotella atomus]|uniref:Coatomer subunit zeta n=1 Tax=Cyclotella atomus TaxID=382360 RepID=A0ABD3P145_9STRA